MREVNYIVSGLPRSGTSLVMQMLKKAGMSIATDGRRKPDDDNPKGYYEIDDIIHKLKEDPKFIYNYTGRVTKVIAFGLQYLPKGNYKIIYIERDIEEVLDSMEKMAQIYDHQRGQTRLSFSLLNKCSKNIMRDREDIDYIIINYNQLLEYPEDVINEISDFINLRNFKKDRMLDVIDVNLYRNRNVYEIK